MSKFLAHVLQWPLTYLKEYQETANACSIYHTQKKISKEVVHQRKQKIKSEIALLEDSTSKISLVKTGVAISNSIENDAVNDTE